jgi:hypothetical protein
MPYKLLNTSSKGGLQFKLSIFSKGAPARLSGTCPRSQAKGYAGLRGLRPSASALGISLSLRAVGIPLQSGAQIIVKADE